MTWQLSVAQCLNRPSSLSRQLAAKRTLPRSTFVANFAQLKSNAVRPRPRLHDALRRHPQILERSGCRPGSAMISWRQVVGVSVAIALTGIGSGCATKSDLNDLSAEQERCAAVWRSRGDPDRALEMQRRSIESRRASANVSSQDDFLGELLDLIFAGTRTVSLKDPRPYNDPRGCE